MNLTVPTIAAGALATRWGRFAAAGIVRTEVVGIVQTKVADVDLGKIMAINETRCLTGLRPNPGRYHLFRRARVRRYLTGLRPNPSRYHLIRRARACGTFELIKVTTAHWKNGATLSNIMWFERGTYAHTADESWRQVRLINVALLG